MLEMNRNLKIFEGFIKLTGRGEKHFRKREQIE